MLDELAMPHPAGQDYPPSVTTASAAPGHAAGALRHCLQVRAVRSDSLGTKADPGFTCQHGDVSTHVSESESNLAAAHAKHM